MRVEAASLPDLVRLARTSSRLSKVGFAAATGLTRAAVDEYEKGTRVPRVDSLLKLLEPADLELHLSGIETRTPEVDGMDLAGFVAALDTDDPQWSWRSLVSDFAANEFAPALRHERAVLLEQEPPLTGSPEWDVFVAALAEHLAFHAAIDAPVWVFSDERKPLDRYWWPVHGSLASMRPAALALSPAGFKRRLIAIDGRELPTIAP